MSKSQAKDVLPEGLRFTVAVVAKAAIANPPDHLRAPPPSSDEEPGEPVEWWSRIGQVWLQGVYAHLNIDYRILPLEPSVMDARSLAGPMSNNDYHKIVSALLTASILPSTQVKAESGMRPSDTETSEAVPRAFGYAAASRAFLARTLGLLLIPTSILLEVEESLGRGLFRELKETEMKEKSEAARREQEHGWGGKWARWAATGGGVIFGGVAIGLTGGLAAPVLLPFIPFLSASSAPIVLGYLFGIAGGGLTGSRVRNRWGGVERFEFEQIAGSNQDSADRQKITYAVYRRKGPTSSNNAPNPGDKQESQEGKPIPPSLVTTICIPGIVVSSEDEGLCAYKDALANTLAKPIRDVFVLKHSPDVMLTTGQTINAWVTDKLLTHAGKEVLARTAFNAVLAAVSLPMTIYSAAGLALDNHWIRASDKARKAGSLLSEVLKEKVQGERPVTMASVGSSLGALALFRALTLLAESDEIKEPLIDSVFLISLPQVVSSQEWDKVRKIVGRRIVNVHNSKDFVLASVGRLHEVVSGAGFGGMAGLNAVNVHGVEDVDMSEIVGGHFDINNNMTKILDILHLQTKDVLPDELRFTIAVVCKAAIVNPPDDLRVPAQGSSEELGDVVDWWQRGGRIWLQDVCAHLDIDHQILPPEPSVLDAESLTGPISHNDYHSITSALLTATILPSPKAKEEANKKSTTTKSSETVARAFGYTAASRAFLAQTLELLSIPMKVLLEVEKDLGRDLFEELKEAEMKEKSEAARKEQENGWGGKWGRWAATGGGVILGGVAIGLTGGLAAPALLPLLPFLSASTAPIVLGSLFGVAGGGLAGNRVRKRWGGVERFEFEQIAGGHHESVAHESVSYTVYQHKGHNPKEREATTEDKADERGAKSALPSLVATICVPGVAVGSEDEGLYAYKDALATTLAKPTRDVFVLKHSPDVMLSTGETLNTWIRNKILTKAGKEVLARTAFNAVMTAVSLPLAIYSTTGLALDNDWIRACDKAKKAGNLLSEVLKEKVQGERPITMIGSSLGALALFKALTVLADSEELKEPLIDSVFFISLPQVVSPREWAKVRRVVGRRVVNVYSSRDLVLASVGRLHEVFSGAGFGGMAGLNAVNAHGVEDIDMSEIVGGHLDINSNMTKVLEVVGVNNRRAKLIIDFAGLKREGEAE
ncbi:hypothetical protein RHS04_01055 [Rhizoctonia solani]|uniref:Uncharacterized protein n=1 Tax=Rhizoctonia solani TaxID=456999 RepID=A0A8H7HFS1_9AGAM|nr:hypothetical protein RHS04_01055 [Rhizoctonia solani]